MAEKFYLTTAIPYVNAAPHLGHVLEFIQTDVIARYQKSQGKEVALVTGADENSLKNVLAAEKQGITVKELCDRNSEIFKDMAQKVGLSFTTFRRTSDKEKHWPGVQGLWQLCKKSGDIYQKKYRGLYCVGCEAFYEESELIDGICPEHRTQPEIVEEENYFFRLSKYQKQLESLIETDELKILPETRKNEVLSFIKGGLNDFSISRSIVRAKGWGVPVPNDQKQIEYVWFDALGTYLTGIGYGTDEGTFSRFWPADVHVIGKGILRFHAIYWPAILLSAGLKLPKTIFVHGYITIDGQKMSKSLGNIVDPFKLVEKYGVDPIRYCLLSEVPTFEDGDFSEKVLMETNNSELLANLGNLVNRTLVFVKNNFDGAVPDAEPWEKDEAFLAEQKKTISEVTADLEKARIKDGLHKIMHLSKNSNRYFQDNKPWELVKTDKERAKAVLRILVSQVKDLAILVEPYLPYTSAEIFAQLSMERARWDSLGTLVMANHKIGTPKAIFRKIEPKEIADLRGRFAGGGKTSGAGGATSGKTPTAFKDLDLEIGQILSIEKHPNAEKLFVEKVLLGDGERQIVSGLVGHYLPEELVGKKVVIVKNLKPAMLRGAESNGMLLVADGREHVPPKAGKGAGLESGALEAIFCEPCKVGQKVTRAGEKSEPKALLTIDDVRSVRIEVRDFIVMSEGKDLDSEGHPLKMKNVREGVVG